MKRLFDIFFSIFAILIFAIPVIVIALLVRIFIGQPVLFTQVRPGRQGEPFKMLKLRTMTNSRDKNGNLLPDDQRLTKFGLILRRTSLDELPEFINVLKGEMSVVGPRPLLMQYLPLYNARQARRHEVRPGITGWAQINGRNTISWDKRFDFDVWYVDNQSMALDIKIIALTILKVIRRENVSAQKSETMSPFMGNG